MCADNNMLCITYEFTGAATRDTRSDFVRKHLDEVGLDGNIAQYNELGSLSGGQKVKVVIAAALWNKPQVLVLGTPITRDTHPPTCTDRLPYRR